MLSSSNVRRSADNSSRIIGKNLISVGWGLRVPSGETFSAGIRDVVADGEAYKGAQMFMRARLGRYRSLHGSSDGARRVSFLAEYVVSQGVELDLDDHSRSSVLFSKLTARPGWFPPMWLLSVIIQLGDTR